MSKSRISLTQPPSSSPASTLSFKSAWAKGPPRSLGTSNPLSPLSPPTSASTDSASSPQDTPSPSISTAEPPPRPKRHPARKESFGGGDEKLTRRPSIRQRSASPSSRDQSSVGGSLVSTSPALESPATIFKWSPMISESQESPETQPVSPTLPPIHNAATEAQSTVPTMSSLPLSPMTTSKSRLHANAQPFIPKKPSSAIVIKNSRGEQVDIHSLSKSTASGTPEFSVAVSNPIKIESEADKKRREEAERSLRPLEAETLSTPPVKDIATPTAEKDLTDSSQELRLVPEALKINRTLDINVPLTTEPTELTKSPTETSDTSNHLKGESIVERSTVADNDIQEDRSSQQLEIPVLATSPPTAPLDSGQMTLPPVLVKPVRERSRRGHSRRGGGGGGGAAATAADATDTAGTKIARTRSGEPRKRPTPGKLDLSGIPKPATVATGALASAIINARPIQDINAVAYPNDVFGPNKELNEGVIDTKFRYDRDFLLQFRGFCTEQPPGMAELEEIGLEPAEQPPPTRSARRRRSVRSNTDSSILSPNPIENTLTVPPTPLIALEEGPSTPTVPATPLSAAMTRTGSRGGRTRKTSGNPGVLATTATTSATATANTITLTLPIPMTRSRSHGSSRVFSSSTLPPPSPLDRRTKSSTARKRSASTRIEVPPLPASLRSPFGTSAFTPGLLSAFENIKPLEFSENRWVPASVNSVRTPTITRTLSSASVQETEPPEEVERKVKSLLNKLTLEKFDSISDQIVSWANRSEAETDGSTLALVIKLVFEKATDEATWSQMYARLCRKMMEQLSTDVTDNTVRDKAGNPVKGGLLFRHHLLSRCQTEFERGWSTRETLEEQQSAVAAASGAAPGEVVFSDEYYALQKAKRRGLGLVKFIGELFKLQMLTERVMHRCILKLLDEPAEEDIESVCQLLKTVGGTLSGAKGKESMDMYFGRMQELSQNSATSQRIRFMLEDVIELRARNWVPKTEVAAPSTLAQVHEAASKDENEKSSSLKLTAMSRGSSRRGQNRSQSGKKREQREPDGQMDRSIGRASGATFGPNLVSLNVVDQSTGVSKSPTKGLAAANAHSLSRLASEPGTSRMSRNPSEPGKSRSRHRGENRQINRRTSVDFGQLDTAIDSSSSGRKRLQLLPRTLGTTTSTVGLEPETPLAATVEEPPAMTEEQALTKIDEDVKEFMQIRDLDEATGYFEALPSEYRHLLVDKFVAKVDAKESDIALVVELFTRVATSGICTSEIFEPGFAPTIGNLDDIAVDVPTAYTVMADMLRASKLQRDTVERLGNGIAVYGQPIVHPREKLMRAFDADI